MNVSIEELINRQFDYKINLFSSKKLEAIDGILELINEIQKKNIKIAIASSSSRKIIELILLNLKLLKKFDVIVSGEEVLHGKPEPDIFLETAKQLKVQRYNCLVIEDSKHGVETAKKANMKCIGFKNPNSGNQDLSLADKIVNSIKQIRLNEFFL